MNEKIFEKLKMISLFEEIMNNRDMMSNLMDIIKTRKCAAGERIITEGEMGDEMYILYSGKVEILKKTRAGDSYTVAVLSAEMNVFFGEMALIDDDTRSATVESSAETELLVIKKSDFLSLGKKHPEIGFPVTRAITRNLAKRIRKTNEDMLTIFDALVNEIND